MALTIRKLPSQQADQVFPKRGQMDLAEYVDALRTLQPGDAAAIDLQGVSSRALKRRLGQAASQAGYRLKWARASSDEAIYFQVLPAPQARSTSASGDKPANGRRGPRRQARETGVHAAPGPAVTAASDGSPRRRRGRPRKAAE